MERNHLSDPVRGRQDQGVRSHHIQEEQPRPLAESRSPSCLRNRAPRTSTQVAIPRIRESQGCRESHISRVESALLDACAQQALALSISSVENGARAYQSGRRNNEADRSNETDPLEMCEDFGV